MKIQKIEVKNFKAVTEQEIEFKGCSAIITAGNNKGKSSILSGLIDRFRGHIPSMIVKSGEEKGFNRIDLDDGSSIEWSFTNKTEKFTYTTKDGIVLKSGVLGQIGEKYFGVEFNIDKFLSSSPAEQTKQLQKIVGLDFTEINERYKNEYDKRADFNKELKRVVGKNIQEPELVEEPKIENIRDSIRLARSKNFETQEAWNTANTKHREKIIQFNADQIKIKNAESNMSDCFDDLCKLELAFGECIDFEQAKKTLKSMPKPQDQKNVENLEAAKLEPTEELENQLEASNVKQREYDDYKRALQTYNDWVAEGKKARKDAEESDTAVKSIVSEKNELIANSDLPENFEIIEDVIHYKGFPLNNSQQSSSAKYIAALELGSMVLGEIKTMHFDASFLDKNSLANVQTWADANDLQLLIERPDFDGGEIQYEIITS